MDSHDLALAPLGLCTGGIAEMEMVVPRSPSALQDLRGIQ